MAVLSEKCSCLAFYSAEKQEIDYKSILSLFLSFAERNDCRITHGAVTGNGYSGSLKSIKLINKQLESNSYQEINSLSVYSVVSEDKTYNEWQFYASVMSSPQAKNCEMVICIDSSHNFIDTPMVADTILKINKLFHVDYAIGYNREYALGPHYYASGVSQGLERNSLEAEKIAEWFRAILNNSFFKRRILRDVYPVNILNNEQLQSNLTSKGILGFQNSLTLEKWIIKNNFGILTKITERLWLWEVKSQIESISQELCKNKLLLYCKSN